MSLKEAAETLQVLKIRLILYSKNYFNDGKRPDQVGRNDPGEIVSREAASFFEHFLPA